MSSSFFAVYINVVMKEVKIGMGVRFLEDGGEN